METMNETVEDITTVNDSGTLVKVIAGVGGTAIIGYGVYKGYKLLSEKVVKPAITKMKSKKESKSEVIDCNCDIK